MSNATTATNSPAQSDANSLGDYSSGNDYNSYDFGADDGSFGSASSEYVTGNGSLNGSFNSSDGTDVGAISIKDLRSQLDDFLNQLNHDSTLTPKDKADLIRAINLYKNQVNAATILGGKAQNTRLSEIQANLVYLESSVPSGGSSGNWGDDLNPGANSADGGGLVTTQSIQDVLSQIKNGLRNVADGSTVTLDQCSAKLQEALKAVQSGDFQKASQVYDEVLGQMGEAKTPTDLAAEQFGATPSKVDGDNIYYDCKDGNTSLDLKSPGNTDTAKTITVDNSTDITFTPANAGDSVSISHEGGYYVIKDGNDTFKINDSAKINIVSDHVTGDVDNSKGNITVGATDATSQKYVSDAKLSDLANKIAAGAAQIAPGSKYTLAYGNDGISQQYDGYPKTILNDISTAIGEKDPKKRADAWTTVEDDIRRLTSQGLDQHGVGDICTLVFNVLYGQLGESDFKDALKQGLIPKDFVKVLSDGLTAVADEKTNDAYKYATGGPNWTHQTCSDFLTENSGSSSSDSSSSSSSSSTSTSTTSGA